MKYLFYITLSVTLINLFSCEEKFINDIDIDVPEQELQLVINLELNAGDTIAKTFVSRTSNITEAESTFFDEAIVELYKNDEFLTLLDYSVESNDYIANFNQDELSEGSYRVEVSGIEGLDDISATQNIPPKVFITNGSYQENGTVEQYYSYAYTVDEATISFTDPGDEENYYQVKLFGIVEDSLGNRIITNDFYVSSLNPIAETGFYQDGILLKDDSFNGGKFDLSIGFNNYLASYNNYNTNEEKYILAVLNNISRDNYLYIRSLDAYESSVDNPFAEPVIVHNNIENGIGIFRSGNATEFRIDFE